MSTQEATSQQPLLQAIDLKKHYPVKKGMFAPELAAVNRPSVGC